jgi:hypothetical protein
MHWRYSAETGSESKVLISGGFGSNKVLKAVLDKS